MKPPLDGSVCGLLTLFDASAPFDTLPLPPPATCFHSPWSLSLNTFCSWLSSLLLPVPICGCSPRFYLQTFPLNDLSAWPGLSRCLLVLCGLGLPSSPRCTSDRHLDVSSLLKGDLKLTIFPPWLSVFPIFVSNYGALDASCFLTHLLKSLAGADESSAMFLTSIPSRLFPPQLPWVS